MEKFDPPSQLPFVDDLGDPSIDDRKNPNHLISHNPARYFNKYINSEL